MSRRLLTIGGPRAGEWVTVDHDAVILPHAAPKPPDPSGWALEPEFEPLLYNVKALILFDRKIWVLLYSQETDPNKALVDALMNGTGRVLWNSGERRP